MTAARHAAAVTFTVEEGRCLDVLAALLGRRRGDDLRGPLGARPPHPALLAAGRDRIARSVARYLTHEEGYRARAFLRGGRRTAGRAWDGHLGVGFVPRFTVASRELWLRGAQHLPALASIDPSAAPRSRERLVAQLVPVEGTASGDWVFYALAHASLRSFLLPAEEERAILRRLRLGSPLAALLDADPDEAEPELGARFAPLLDPANARVVECVEARLASAWGARARACGSWRLAPAELMRRWGSLGRCLHAWLDGLDATRRMDLARPLLTFAAGVTAEVFHGGAEATRAAVSAVPGVRSVRERDQLLAAVARVVDVGGRLLRIRDRLALERYGDERHEEAQLYVREADQRLGPARRRTESLARGLVGAVG